MDPATSKMSLIMSNFFYVSKIGHDFLLFSKIGHDFLLCEFVCVFLFFEIGRPILGVKDQTFNFSNLTFDLRSDVSSQFHIVFYRSDAHILQCQFMARSEV